MVPFILQSDDMPAPSVICKGCQKKIIYDEVDASASGATKYYLRVSSGQKTFVGSGHDVIPGQQKVFEFYCAWCKPEKIVK